MTKNELLQKYDELVSTYTDKEAKLEVFIQNWLDGNSALQT